ncbi:MAG: metallophosphoesterase [Lentisphaeria bacterium]|nr:metallophosphoesterase [Lentisphaeria bacterium]
MKLFFILLLLLTVAYAPCSIGFSLPLKRFLRAVTALLLFFLAIGMQVILFTGILPRPALLPAAWLSGTLIFATPMLFVRDLAVLFLRSRGKKPGKWNRYALAGILAVSGVLAAWGEYCAVKPPQVKRVELVRDIPAGLDGFKIVYISDIHVSRTSSRNYLWTVVCRANALRPDVILLGGDLGDLKPEEIRPNMHQLGDLHAKYGVYSSPGNHEYFRGFEEWLEFLDSVGIESLLNRHAVIEHNGAEIVIAGVPDEAKDNKMYEGRELPDLDKTLAGAPEGAPVVLLAHKPQFAHDYSAYPVMLQLSGHTHGGMVAGLPALLVKLFNKGFVSGLYEVNGMTLYVSNGAGLWNGFMFRLGVPSEITEITLRSRNKTETARD